MDLNYIFSDAIRYPFRDYKKLLILGLLLIFTELGSIYLVYGSGNIAIYLVACVIGLIFGIYVAGYSISVMNKGTEYSDDVPEFDLHKNFIDGFKTFIISIIYFIIPTIILIVAAILFAGISALLSSLQIAIILFIILFVIAIIAYILFAINEAVALARFAYYDDWTEALSFSSVYEDTKEIGAKNIILFIIMMLIIFMLILAISAIIDLIPYVGLLISCIIVKSFATLFYARAIGLFYSEK